MKNSICFIAIALLLALHPAQSYAQPGNLIAIFCGSMTTTCGGDMLVPAGTVVSIWRDVTDNGPTPDDVICPDEVTICEAPVSHLIGECPIYFDFVVTIVDVPLNRYYLTLDTELARWNSQTFYVPDGFNDLEVLMTCVEIIGTLLPPSELTVMPEENGIRLNWLPSATADYYRIETGDVSGEFTHIVGTTSTTSFLDSVSTSDYARRFYQVIAIRE